MSKLLGTDYQVFQCDDRIPRSLNEIIDIWNQFTDTLWPRSRGLNSGYLLEQIKFAPIFALDINTGAVGESTWTTAKYVLTLNALRWNDFYIANKTAGTITYEGKLTDENDNDISGLISRSLLTEGTIEMIEGLSAKWIAEVKDTYFP